MLLKTGVSDLVGKFLKSCSHDVLNEPNILFMPC